MRALMTPRWTDWPQGLLFLIQPPQLLESSVDPQDFLPTTPKEWQEWHRVVSHNEIQPQILAWVDAFDLNVPEIILRELEEKRVEISEATQKRWEHAQIVLAAASNAQLEFVLLKGNAIAIDIYNDTAYKKMNDVDILIRAEDRDRWWSLILDCGFRAAAAVGRHPRADERHSHHWPPLFSRDLKCVLGVHWGLASPLRKERLNIPLVWQRLQPTHAGSNFLVSRLGSIDFLLHLCVHLSATKVGLREISDLVNFYQHAQVDLHELAALAEQSRAIDGFCRAFGILNSLFIDNEIEDVLAQYLPKASRAVRAELIERGREERSFLMARTNLVSKIEMAYGLFQLTEHPLEKAYFLGRMWRHLLIPPIAEARRFCYQPESRGPLQNLRVRWLTPIRVMKTMAQDLGWPLLIAITLRHELQLMASIPQALKRKIQGRPLRGLREVAQAAGVEIETLRSAKFLN